jgi:hypothetical protein
MEDEKVIPWIKCDCCDDYQCNIHSEAGRIAVHVHDCDCPGIETWAEYDLMPYEECSLLAVEAMIENES